MGLLLASPLLSEDWDLVVGGRFLAFLLGGSFCVCVYYILINCLLKTRMGTLKCLVIPEIDPVFDFGKKL